MTEPAELVAAMEDGLALPAGDNERFSGYGVMGLPFASGHILAMRRFPASSIGPGYTSVWHRDPAGRWVFHQDRPPAQACSRYFGSALRQTTESEIRLEWSGPRSLTVMVLGEPNISWDITLAPTTATRVLNGVGRLLPESWWQRPRILALMGRIASTMLRAGKVQLEGRVPNGQRFIANPRQIWMIPVSHAMVDGHDLGPTGSTAIQARLGEFWIPTRGIFAIGQAYFGVPAGRQARNRVERVPEGE